MTPGQSVNITYDVTVAQPLNAPATQINNQASIASGNVAPVLSDDSAVGGVNDITMGTVLETQTDLVVTNTDTPDPVLAGNNITYTIYFINNRSDAASANCQFVSSSVVIGTGNVIFSKATVVSVETAQFQIVVKVLSETAGATVISNTVTVATTTNEPMSGNNSQTTTVAIESDLAVTKSDIPDPVNAGENITYTVDYVNNGPSDAQTVTVTDAVPTNTTFQSAVVTTDSPWSTSAPAVGATGSIVFSKATSLAADTAQFTVVVKVNAATPNATVLTNTAIAASPTSDPTAGNNNGTTTSTVQFAADLVLTVGDSPAPIRGRQQHPPGRGGVRHPEPAHRAWVHVRQRGQQRQPACGQPVYQPDRRCSHRRRPLHRHRAAAWPGSPPASPSRPGTASITTAGVTGENTATAAILDNGDGTYTATYTSTIAGVDTVVVTIGGAPLAMDMIVRDAFGNRRLSSGDIG